MRKIYFLRHFQTEVDPDVPVSEWELSEEGKAEMKKFLESELPDVDIVYTSPEYKAKKVAENILEKTGIEFVTCDELSEVDRSRRGFIEKQSEYVETAREYLQNERPETAWEPKSVFKSRVKEFIELLENTSYERILVIGHGLYFSILLGGDEPYWFWRDLEFGEIIEKDFNHLPDLKSQL